jgi:hypothetical protein
MMRYCLLYVLLGVLFFSAGLYAAITVNVTAPEGGSAFNGNTVDIVFSWNDDNNVASWHKADINYRPVSGGTPTVIATGVSLTSSPHTYTWDVSNVGDNQYYVDVNVYNDLGTSTVATSSAFYIDKTPPSDVNNLRSTSHTTSTWSSDPTVDVAWDASTDATSGIAGYILVWDTNSNTVPTNCGSITTSNTNATSSSLSTGNSHYVHIRAVDNAGNCSTNTTHLGPFYIDVTPPSVSNYSPANGSYTNDTTPTISFDITDAHSKVDWNSLIVKVNSQDVTNDVNYTAITDGNRITYTPANPVSGTVTVNVDVNDNAGASVSASWSFTVDANAPTISSFTQSYGSDWTNDETPEFSISASDTGGSGLSKMAFSCNNSTWSSEVTYATTYSSFDITSSSAGCTTSDGEKTVYVKVKDAAGNWSSAASTTVKYDNSPPNPPTISVESEDDGSFTISWSAPSDVGPAGILSYEVYLDGSLYASTSNTYYTFTNLTNDTTYRAKVKAKDYAGNRSDFSNEVSATPTSTPAPTITIKVINSAGIYTDVLTHESVTIQVTSTGELYDAYLYIDLPSGETVTLYSNLDNVSNFSKKYIMPAEKGVATIRLVAKYGKGKSVEKQHSVTIDPIPPTVSITEPSPNAVLSETVELKALASDEDTDITSVEFYLNNNKLGAAANSDTTEWTMTWDTTQTNNGTYLLKVLAYDSAGNVGTAEIQVSVENLPPEAKWLKEEQKKLEADKNAASKVQEELLKFGMPLPSELKLLKDAADKNFQAFKQSFSAGKYTDANATLLTARALYQAIANFEVKEYKQHSTAFKKADLPASFDRINLSQALRDEVLNIFKSDHNIERTFTIVKLYSKDMNFLAYYIVVRIVLPSDLNAEGVQILEFIPKKFTQNASEIVSLSKVTVVESDPVLMFALEDANEVSYLLNKPFTQAQIDALVNESFWKEFTVAPILFKKTTNITKNDFTVPESQKVTTSSTPEGGRPQGGFPWLWVMIGLLIIGLAIIAAVALGMGRVVGKEEGTPLEQAAKKVEKPKARSIVFGGAEEEKEKGKKRWEFIE